MDEWLGGRWDVTLSRMSLLCFFIEQHLEIHQRDRIFKNIHNAPTGGVGDFPDLTRYG